MGEWVGGDSRPDVARHVDAIIRPKRGGRRDVVSVHPYPNHVHEQLGSTLLEIWHRLEHSVQHWLQHPSLVRCQHSWMGDRNRVRVSILAPTGMPHDRGNAGTPCEEATQRKHGREGRVRGYASP
jgi:hypothetical protein